ncbi:type II CRISPR RNA-guided endonuclease Cas9 [Sediminibacterium soli]|uniref:type II CRISPR RNA-guided endonuclease Cas9 n=1 Tax=Sediminibacterium soli TaxID=2698829 RepID=UPI00137985A1|nr:type II CRISPR RNA-guided endonuclease Cas9 [Sediminibacterium soli]NCI47376.1 type II CRISPR RNA-guided endonuclease Cas9 [Sediminibacterium soli]
MKKILGLDLGVTSIGWSVVTEKEDTKEILGMGSRIIPLSTDDKDEFSSGNKISKNQKNTTRRTQRKGYDRYQLRRKRLTEILISKNMFDPALFTLTPLQLWGLRAKAAGDMSKPHKIQDNAKVTLQEFGRILYHLNQKRGYKSSRSDANLDKKETEYVAEVKNRHQQIREQNLTIGQNFLRLLNENANYRIKQQVFPREAYMEEFDSICRQQQKHHPDQITDDFIDQVKNEIIYYQRKLKSQKGLVSICDFEGFWIKNKITGKDIFSGPKVCHRSSPLFQVCKLWETINTITLKNKKGEILSIPLEKKQDIFNYLDTHEKMSAAQLLQILGLNRNEGWYTNKQIERGLQGNVTNTQLLKYFSDGDPLLKFDLTVSATGKDAFLVDKRTGEVIGSAAHRLVEDSLEQEPMYRLWHTIYSIRDTDECKQALTKNFNIDESVAEKLSLLDFAKYSFGNKSAKAIRKMLPFLLEGYVYSDACSFAGYNHSDSYTKEEQLKKKLLDRLPLLAPNSLRQPVVEKILNQMINLVNAVLEKYGPIDEIRIELARELKQSKEERNDTFANLSKREKENIQIQKRIEGEYGLRSTRKNVIKWRLFHEIKNEETNINAICLYCGKPFGITDSLRGNSIDIEHIIPKSLLFDDSQSNKTLSHRSCNELKGNKTAYDFMKSKSEEEFAAYLDLIDTLFKNKIIGKAKRDKLLMTEEKIPKDFIERQLRQTQYIARKAREILEQVCHTVWSTSGSITEYLRRTWGWDDALMNLQLPKYRELGLTEWKEWETNDGQIHKKEIIKDWSKRDDHRHHAIDALVIACTQQAFIQRINNLSAKGNREEMYREIPDAKSRNISLLECYIVSKRPFTTKEVAEKASEILISFKSGKKVATFGVRKIKQDGKTRIVQKNIIVPRGPLSEESVYGKIRAMARDTKTGQMIKYPVKFLFEHPEKIVKSRIRKLVETRLAKFENDQKKALASLKKEPLYLDSNHTTVLEYATCYSEEYVIKYPLGSIKANDVPYIVDGKIQLLIKDRLEKHNNKEKEAFKEPLFYDAEKKIPIRSVRMFTGLSNVEPVKKDTNGRNIGFVKPGNNHHIAFYIDESGKVVEHSCTFWHAVERKKYGIPVIIKEPGKIWDKLLNGNYPEEFLNKLPKDQWIYQESLQQNEMFILGFGTETLEQQINNTNKITLSQNLYRVQKMSIKGNGQLDITFRHHLETQLNDSSTAKESKRFYNIQSIGAFEKLNPQKIRITGLGDIQL